MTNNIIPFRTGPSRRGHTLARARVRHRASRPSRDVDMERVALTIEEFGLHLVHVGEQCDCPDCPTAPVPPHERFGYTVGLTAHQHPELLVRGLGASETAGLLNRWGGAVLAGDVFEIGHILCEGPAGRRWELVEAPRPAQTLVWAARFYGPDRLAGRPPLELLPSERECPCSACV